MILSRSNSLVMSAACHVSTLRRARSPFGFSKSTVRDDNLREMRHSDESCHRSPTGGSVVIEEVIELQPLVSESHRGSDASASSTLASTHAHLRGLTEDSPSIAAGTSADDFRGDRDAEAGDTIVCTAQLNRDDGSATAESQQLLTVTIDNERRRSTISSLDADDTADRLKAARELEDGSVSEEDDAQFRVRLSRSRIRWGVVSMPDEFYTQFGDPGDGVKFEHLTFGIEEQDVAAPVNDPHSVYA